MVQVLSQEGFADRLGRGLGSGIGGVLQSLANQKLEDIQRQRQEKQAWQEYNALVDRGFTPEEASLWMQFTQGGKTHLAKQITERLQRERQGEKVPQLDDELGLSETLSPNGDKFAIAEEGLTPKENIARQESRYKTNLPFYQKAQDQLKALDAEDMSLQRLRELNDSGALPKGLQRWNVNLSSGELRFPFVANAETQAFVKTINDFTTKAKDSFGARVTNFELDRFMKRLPTLLNTEEGRDTILRQMEIINEINRLYAQGTLNAFESRGGIRKLDIDEAERIGKREIKDRLKELKKEYTSLDRFSSSKPQQEELKKVEKGTKLSEAVVDKLLRQSGNDPQKAKELAKKLGYEIEE